jgi:hypothetical protein
MKQNKNYPLLRRQAIEWLKTGKDFHVGISILQESGYKPVVASKIAKWGNQHPFAAEKLTHELSSFVRLWANPTSSEHNDEKPEPPKTPTEEMQEDEVKTLSENPAYPTEIRHALHEFYRLMKERREAHAAATAIEGTDKDVQAARADAFKHVEALSARMDTLWAAKTAYEQDGSIPADLFPETPPEQGESNTDEDIASMDLETLKKSRKNEAVKLTRAKNMLEYSQEIKKDSPDPMPVGPKRLKQEKRIAKLTALIEKIDYRIVELS